jgi:hypothetical protein
MSQIWRWYVLAPQTLIFPMTPWSFLPFSLLEGGTNAAYEVQATLKSQGHLRWRQYANPSPTPRLTMTQWCMRRKHISFSQDLLLTLYPLW